MSYTVLIPYTSEAPTPWHPTDANGPFACLARGAFATEDEAHEWAKTHIPGHAYTVRNNAREDYPIASLALMTDPARAGEWKHFAETRFSAEVLRDFAQSVESDIDYSRRNGVRAYMRTGLSTREMYALAYIAASKSVFAPIAGGCDDDPWVLIHGPGWSVWIGSEQGGDAPADHWTDC